MIEGPNFRRYKLQSSLFQKNETSKSSFSKDRNFLQFWSEDRKIVCLSVCLSDFQFSNQSCKKLSVYQSNLQKKQKNLDLLNRPFDPSQNVEWFRFTKLVFLWKMKRTLKASNLIFLKSIPESLQCSSLPIKLSRRPLRNLDCNVSQTKKFSNPF